MAADLLNVLQPAMFGGQTASAFGAPSSSAPFGFGQQPNAAPAPTFGQSVPAFGQAPSVPAPAFSGSFGGPAGAGFAAGTSNAAPAARRKVVRRKGR